MGANSLYEIVETPGSPQILYFPTNVHLTQLGHAKVAEILSSTIEGLHLKLGLGRMAPARP